MSEPNEPRDYSLRTWLAGLSFFLAFAAVVPIANVLPRWAAPISVAIPIAAWFWFWRRHGFNDGSEENSERDEPVRPESDEVSELPGWYRPMKRFYDISVVGVLVWIGYIGKLAFQMFSGHPDLPIAMSILAIVAGGIAFTLLLNWRSAKLRRVPTLLQCIALAVTYAMPVALVGVFLLNVGRTPSMANQLGRGKREI